MNNLKGAVNFIKKYQSFIVTSHHNPDADAAGSSLAMAILLKLLGKKVKVLNEDDLASWMKFLPCSTSFQKVNKTSKVDYQAVIVLDSGDQERIGGVNHFITDKTPVLNIDHHKTNTKFGHVNCVFPKASSTSEIIYQLFKEFKKPFTKDAAILLYAGIMTDTGSFRFDNVAPSTFAAAAELITHGVDVAQMHDRLYRAIPINDIKAYVEVIHQAELLFGKKVYCVVLPKIVLKKFSKDFDLKERIFTFLRAVDGIDVVVILNEIDKKQVRINLRSQGKFDVARLAQSFNGGGHARAAGAKMEGALITVKKKVLSALKKQMKG